MLLPDNLLRVARAGPVLPVLVHASTMEADPLLMVPSSL